MAGLKSIVADHVVGEWFSGPELRLRDHHFTVPLDYSQSTENSPKISIFAREVVSVGKEDDEAMPYLLYLEGGPGVPSPRPTESTGWLERALKDYRVVLIDSRGTGLSTALTSSSMLQFDSPTELVEYIKHFRADNIVNDAEFVRKRIVPGAGPWTVLGQSYGGFCAVTYLSFAAQGLKQVLLAGGIPPIGKGCTGDFAEKACFEQIRVQNHKYYQRFPQDAELVRDLVHHLSQCEKGGVDLPSGGILTPKGLQSLGLYFLGAHLGFERLHYMLETVWDSVIVPGAPKRISDNFLHEFENCVSYKTTLLSPLLGEAAYCQGASSRWAAQRARDKFGSEFDPISASKEGRPVLFTSEMFFPWIFDEFENLRPFKAAAHILAHKEDWPMLYDIDALNNNKVPVVAAIYYEDTSVGFKASTETASQIAGIRLFVTNEYLHSGLSDSGGRVFDYLMGMLSGKKPLF